MIKKKEEKSKCETQVSRSNNKLIQSGFVLENLINKFELHRSTYIFILTSAASVLGVFVKALEKVYQYSRYKELAVPTKFLNQEVSVGDFFPFIFMTICFCISLIVLVLALPIYRQVKESLKLEKKLKISFKRKLEHIVIKLFFPVLGLIVISAINYPGLQLFSNIDSIALNVFACVLFFFLEYRIAKVILDIFEDFKVFEREPIKTESQKPDEMTDEDFKSTKDACLKSTTFINCQTLLKIISVLLILVVFVGVSANVGRSSIRNGRQQIVFDEDGSTFIVLEMYDDKYIVSPVSITDDGTITIYNKTQTLIDSKGMDYTYVLYSKVILETDDEKVDILAEVSNEHKN